MKMKKNMPPCQECSEGGMLLFFLRDQCVLLYHCGYLYIMLYMLLLQILIQMEHTCTVKAK